MGQMIKIGSEGDLKISWNRNNEDEVRAAKEVFDEKIKAGWSAFKDKGAGTKGDKIRIFDETAERIVLVPNIAGGEDEEEDDEYIDRKNDDEKDEKRRRRNQENDMMLVAASAGLAASI